MKQPTLRFQQFRDNWKVKTINDLGTIGRGKSKHRPRNDSRLYGVEYPFVQTSDIRNAGLFLNSFSQAYSEFGLNQSKLWPQGTLCITIAANIAETSILGIEACFPDSIIGFTSNSQKSDEVFVKMYFEYINPTLQKLSEGVAQSNLNLEKLSSIEFTVPSLLEQQKIASFFMLLNKKIEKQQEKIEKLEELKKGLMQKIFSQELRFKDEHGGEFSAWERIKLGKIAKVYDGTHATPDYVSKGIPFFSVESITKSNYTNTKFVSLDAYQIYKKRVAIEKNDILMTRIGSIGDVKLVDWDFESTFYVSLALIKPNDKTMSSYISQYIKTQECQKDLQKRSLTTAVPQKINLGEISEIEILLPSLKEQIKISKLLSNIDSKIEQEKSSLDSLENLKKGFMQQMFV